ncbi:hypothetical protein EDC19_2680 [Natranaerovirga hydrolytica]|uniref:DUF7973 domain-containing protein n=1 Tax=Natranaerovirga hydrolytica TaxID=680378 RepID=A0A4R1MDV3_9FIRM|nr:hypothetical protein [Natranaerovirga hydrolytica]TCK88033.1 hypothetical protein EDC19_2680 [Natranaerovirga hydrolytica]
MDIFALIAAFGGGMLGAILGGLPAFILIGVFATIGGLMGMAGITEHAIGTFAFGSFLGPHIAFASGVAAAAYAANKRKVLENGKDILTPLNGTSDYSVLCVGGIFGVFGFLLQHLYGNILNLSTDIPALAVFTMAIVTRFAFGNTGLFGKYQGTEPRVWFSKGQKMLYNIVLGGGIGIVISGVAISLINSGASAQTLAMYPIVCFGFSAIHLIFVQMGFPSPSTHHITLTSASAAVLSGNIFVGIITAILCTLLGDLASNVFNEHGDTHFDPPAATIFIAMFVINFLF